MTTADKIKIEPDQIWVNSFGKKYLVKSIQDNIVYAAPLSNNGDEEGAIKFAYMHSSGHANWLGWSLCKQDKPPEVKSIINVASIDNTTVINDKKKELAFFASVLPGHCKCGILLRECRYHK